MSDRDEKPPYTKAQTKQLYRKLDKARKNPWRPRLVTIATSLDTSGELVSHRIAIEVLQLVADEFQEQAAVRGAPIPRKDALHAAVKDELGYRGLTIAKARAFLYRVVRLDQMRRKDAILGADLFKSFRR